MAVLREIIVKTKFEFDKKKVESANAQLKKFAKRATVAATAVTALGTAAIVKFTKDTAAAGDEAAKMAVRMGTTAERVQELSFIMQLAGGTVSEAEKSFKKLSQSAAEAQDGTETYTSLFKELGVAVEDGNGQLKQQEVLFEEVVEALGSMEDQTRAAAISAEVFGRAGTKMLNVARVVGKDGFDPLRQEAQDLGFVLSDEVAAQAEEFNDNWLRLKLTLVGVRNTLGMQLMPILENLVNTIREWVKQNRELVVELSSSIAGVVKGFVTVAMAVFQFFLGLGKLPGPVQKLIILLTTLVAVVAPIVAAFGAIVAGISAALPVLTAIWGFITFTFIPTLLSLIPIVLGMLAPIAAVAAAFAAGFLIGRFIRNHWEGIKSWFASALKSIGLFFTGLWISVREGFIAAFVAVREFSAGVWESIKQGFVSAFQSIGNFLIQSIAKWMRFLTAPLRLMGRLLGIDVGAALANVQGAISGGLGLNSGAGAALAGAGGGGISQTANVGAVNVSIEGSTNMGPDQVSRAVARGTEQGLGDQMRRVDQDVNRRRRRGR